jgi:hypothetical protein
VKAIKMIGLAALTALMAMAFVGATSAMAEKTTLCTADESPCALANHVNSVSEKSVGKAKLLTSFGTTECNVSFSGDVVEKGTSPLVISGSFTYTECTLGGSSCTATEESGPAEIKVLKEGHETGKVTGEGLVHLVCGKSIDCSYNGTGLVGTAKGPLLSTQANGEVTLSEQSTTKETGGFLCPKTAKLDITTTPSVKTYITAGGAELKMVCVSVGPNNGFWLAGGNGVACEVKHGTRLGEYELGWATPGVGHSEMACVWIGNTSGFWLAKTSSAECAVKDGTRLGEYELGVTT